MEKSTELSDKEKNALALDFCAKQYSEITQDIKPVIQPYLFGATMFKFYDEVKVNER